MKEPHAKVASVAAKKSAPSPGFDTMAAVNTLTKAGIEQRPADAIVGVVRDAQCELATEESLLSTKLVLESDMTTLKADLRAEMAELRVELRSEMAELKAELRSEMTELKVELKSDMAGLKLGMKNLEASIEKQFAQLYRYLLVGGGGCVAAIVGILSVTT
ncbi:MAG: hypothetical protein OXN23_00870 [Gammaproteobacteria bacterium]|nr:hypothetical protein [Gammaproteobacteria bacterium]